MSLIYNTLITSKEPEVKKFRRDFRRDTMGSGW